MQYTCYVYTGRLCESRFRVCGRVGVSKITEMWFDNLAFISGLIKQISGWDPHSTNKNNRISYILSLIYYIVYIYNRWHVVCNIVFFNILYMEI